MTTLQFSEAIERRRKKWLAGIIGPENPHGIDEAILDKRNPRVLAIFSRAMRIAGETTDSIKLDALKRLLVNMCGLVTPLPLEDPRVRQMPIGPANGSDDEAADSDVLAGPSPLDNLPIDHALACLDRFTGQHLAVLQFLQGPLAFFGWNPGRWLKENNLQNVAGTFTDRRCSCLGSYLPLCMPGINEPDGMLRAIVNDLHSAGLTEGFIFERPEDWLSRTWLSPLGFAVCELFLPPPAREPTDEERREAGRIAGEERLQRRNSSWLEVSNK